jgi:hypothetical protein
MLPLAGGRNSMDSSLYNQGSNGFYWSSSPNDSFVYPGNVRNLLLGSSDVDTNVVTNSSFSRAFGLSIRCFKDSPDAPETLTITFDENG